MRKTWVVLLFSLAIVNTAFAEEKKEENIFKKVIETVISPMETILGPVADLGQVVITPTRTEEKLGAASSSITVIKPSRAEKNNI